MQYSTAKKIKSANYLSCFIPVLIMGVAFLVFSLMPSEDDSAKDLVFILISVALIVVGAVGTVVNIMKIVKKKETIAANSGTGAKDMAGLPEGEASAAYDPENGGIYADPDEAITYYFGWCGKMNQSYRMEDAGGTVWYEGNLQKFSLLGASDYVFLNHATGASQNHTVGKTVTTSQGGIMIDSYFKLDGENVLEMLERKGYNYRTSSINPIHPEFTLSKNGTVVAKAALKMKAKTKESEPGVMKSSNVIIETTKGYTDMAFIMGMIILRCNGSVATM